MNYRSSKPTVEQQKWIDRYVHLVVEVDRSGPLYRAYHYVLNEQGLTSDVEKLRIYYPFGVDRKEYIKERVEEVRKNVIDNFKLQAFTINGGWALLDEQGILGFLIEGIEGATCHGFTIYSTEEFVVAFKERFETVFDQTKPPSIKRIRLNRQKDELYAWSEVIATRPFNDRLMDMYPFLNRSPAETWAEFAASDSNILLLIGPPGTGKSNFINEMVRARGYDDRNVYLADQDHVLAHGDLTSFIRGVEDNSLIITEDSDKMVAKREDGNSNMSGLLNATAGLVSTKTKIIISTNLPTIRDVDEALVRPGRAFDILTFKIMSATEANKAREANGLEPADFFGDGFTLAEALNTGVASTPRKANRIGF